MKLIESPVYQAALLRLKERYKTEFELIYKEEQDKAFAECPSSYKGDFLLKAIALATGLPSELIRGHGRWPEILEARFILALAISEKTSHSLTFIGKWMGGKDAKTIVSYIKHGKELLNSSPKWYHIYSTKLG